MTGFDSGQDRYVSMQCIGDKHFNLIAKTITGENNYALAAWSNHSKSGFILATVAGTGHHPQLTSWSLREPVVQQYRE
jgi:hypothetical protein